MALSLHTCKGKGAFEKDTLLHVPSNSYEKKHYLIRTPFMRSADVPTVVWPFICVGFQWRSLSPVRSTEPGEVTTSEKTLYLAVSQNFVFT